MAAYSGYAVGQQLAVVLGKVAFVLEAALWNRVLLISLIYACTTCLPHQRLIEAGIKTVRLVNSLNTVHRGVHGGLPSLFFYLTELSLCQPKAPTDRQDTNSLPNVYFFSRPPVPSLSACPHLRTRIKTNRCTSSPPETATWPSTCSAT